MTKVLLIKRILLLLLISSTGFWIAALFAGIAWGVLFIAFIHLLITFIPFNQRLAQIALDTRQYERLKRALAKGKNLLVYKVTIIFTNLLFFFMAITLFSVNIKLLDYLR